MSEIQTPEIDSGPAEKILADMKNPEADALIPILQRIQEAYGYLPHTVLKNSIEDLGRAGVRMSGVDKAFLSLKGEDFIGRKIRQLGPLFDEILVVVRETGPYLDLPAVYPLVDHPVLKSQ